MFFRKSPKCFISFCKYFSNKPWVLWSKYFKGISPVLEGHVSPIFLSCLTKYCSRHSVSEEENKMQMKNRKEIQVPPWFKFFVVEEVMLSPLAGFEKMNLNSEETGNSFYSLSFKSFWKVSNFAQVSITQTNKLSI